MVDWICLSYERKDSCTAPVRSNWMQLGVVFLEVQSRLFYEAWSCIGSGFVRGFTSQESRKPCRYPAGFKPRFFTFKGNWIAKVAFHSYCIWQLSISILENSCHALDYSGHMGVLSIINCHAIGIGFANEQFGILADCELKLVSNWQIVGCTVAAPSHLLHCNTALVTLQHSTPHQHSTCYAAQ